MVSAPKASLEDYEAGGGEEEEEDEEEEDEDLDNLGSRRSGPLVITDSFSSSDRAFRHGEKRRRKSRGKKTGLFGGCCGLVGFQPFCLRTRLSIISDPGVPVIAKIIWTCVLISVIALAAYLIYELSREYYLESGLRTELEIVSSREVELPEIHLHHANQIR